MVLNWQSLDDYPGGKAMFWVDDDYAEYAVFGWIEDKGDGPRIWDDNDFGYAHAQYVAFWAPCKPPNDQRH